MDRLGTNSRDPEQDKSRGKKKSGFVSCIDFRPCEVCGGKSTGFHFGAITYEACKVWLLCVCVCVCVCVSVRA